MRELSLAMSCLDFRRRTPGTCRQVRIWKDVRRSAATLTRLLENACVAGFSRGVRAENDRQSGARTKGEFNVLWKPIDVPWLGQSDKGYGLGAYYRTLGDMLFRQRDCDESLPTGCRDSMRGSAKLVKLVEIVRGNSTCHNNPAKRIPLPDWPVVRPRHQLGQDVDGALFCCSRHV
jgi:hypothetical protein